MLNNNELRQDDVTDEIKGILCVQVTQYSCDFPNLAPEGCTQYYFGSTLDIVQTYNYVGGQHLANQDQQICIR